ncbi:MAG: hypothetical protein AB7O45_17250 [Alphaproteobacteria bacterium]
MRWSDAIRALVVLALLAAGACQPLPRPLADLARPGPELLTLPGRGGVVVLEVEGLAEARAQALAEAMAKALTEADVPATIGGGTRESLFLLGRADVRDAGGRLVELTFAWELYDEASRLIGSRTNRQVVAARDWAEAQPGDLARLARASAPGIAEIYFGGMPKEAGERPRPAIVVAAIKGAPGDGARSLARAIATTLESARLVVVADRAQAVAVIEGAVSVEPGKARGTEAVEIKWRVSLPGGQEVGVVSQANEIPAGTLKGAWGETAAAIAIAAGPGIVDLIARIPADPRPPPAAPAGPVPAAASPPAPAAVPPAAAAEPAPVLPPRPPRR